MKKCLFLFVLFSVGLTSFSQHKFGAKFGIGVSKIDDLSNYTDADHSSSFKLSNAMGLSYTYGCSKIFLLGAELQLSQINGREIISFNLTDVTGNKIGNGNTIITKKCSYFSAPVYFGFKLKKVSIMLGFQFSYNLSSSSNVLTELDPIAGDSKFFESQFTTLLIKPYDFGPRMAVSYTINEKLDLELNSYYGITNIVDRSLNTSATKWINMQTLVSAKYSFLTSDGRASKRKKYVRKEMRDLTSL